MIDKSTRWEIAHTLIAALLALVLGAAAMELWRADLRVPLERHGDGLLHSVMVRAALEEGWPVTVDRAGEPGILDFRDFPAVDNFNLLLIRLLGFFIPDFAVLINVFFLLTFPLIGAAAFAVSRRVGLSRPASYLIAILYALLPYHFGRAIGHLFLSAYAIVPFAILVALKIAAGERLFSRDGRRTTFLAVLFCLILGSSGVYYPFFASIFILLAGISGSLARKNIAPLRTAATVVGIVLVSLVLNHLPSILKERREGSLEVAKRVPAEAEIYGLKVAQLILPASDHRIRDWADAKRRYNAASLVTENDMSTLGLFATAGFLFLLGWLLWGNREAAGFNDANRTLTDLSVLNAGGVLYGTIGGFASIFALWISPQIRSVNRISIFIAFISMLAAGLIFDRLTRGRARWVAPAAAALLTIAGALDQTTSVARRFHGEPGSFYAFRDYVRKIDASLPPGSEIFQLPYFPFPENGWVGGIGDYEHFRPYLHSSDVAWSYGAVRGSVGDLWQKEIASLPAEAMVRELVLAGFEGIWIDRRGYSDRAAALEEELSRFTGAIPFQSPDGDYAFLPLQLARYRLSRQMSRAEWDAASAAASGRILASWRSGFSGLENDTSGEWRWGSRRGELMIHNLGSAPSQSSIRFFVETGRDDPSTFEIASAFWNETLSLGAEPTEVERTITVPPGSHRVKFRSSARPIDAPGDPRVLVFRISNFEVGRRADEESPIRSSPI